MKFVNFWLSFTIYIIYNVSLVLQLIFKKSDKKPGLKPSHRFFCGIWLQILAVFYLFFRPSPTVSVRCIPPACLS